MGHQQSGPHELTRLDAAGQLHARLTHGSGPVHTGRLGHDHVGLLPAKTAVGQARKRHHLLRAGQAQAGADLGGSLSLLV
jgi:hypothetical protein